MGQLQLPDSNALSYSPSHASEVSGMPPAGLHGLVQPYGALSTDCNCVSTRTSLSILVDSLICYFSMYHRLQVSRSIIEWFYGLKRTVCRRKEFVDSMTNDDSCACGGRVPFNWLFFGGMLVFAFYNQCMRLHFFLLVSVPLALVLLVTNQPGSVGPHKFKFPIRSR